VAVKTARNVSKFQNYTRPALLMVIIVDRWRQQNDDDYKCQSVVVIVIIVQEAEIDMADMATTFLALSFV
jgi:hypothetical protein